MLDAFNDDLDSPNHNIIHILSNYMPIIMTHIYNIENTNGEKMSKDTSFC
jgi:predicted aldo/keto reductase-like oxidoreductase